MMKSLFLNLTALFLVSFFATTSFAVSNPWIRTCQAKHGEFFVAGAGEANDATFCKFGNAMIGAETLFLHATQLNTKAVQVYVANQTGNQDGNNVCYANSGVVKSVSGDQGDVVNYCYFVEDTSIIEIQTLGRGYLSPLNSQLNLAL